ncbi:PaiB family negative transcriptional regulator [Hoeflea marina]|uniref:PaiB family negative transcriptional regulator n=1 Tax=Hoeflea marina TaxID=274592 RepID=A0A317PGA2_9HYPH|nr:FMN-binding negative transcriptional regulator [Hoeflea marina]PWV97681.1 PaiB family negative transcriptional regulator [Hoeflea marina]
MHPNPIYRTAPRRAHVDFARARGFGSLAVNGPDGPLMSHIPFRLSEDGTRLEAHLVRSNPIFRLLADPQPAVIAVTGADAYVSPDWYGLENQVPTWNYVAVHLRGRLEVLEQGDLHGILERLSAQMESRIAGKTPWKIDKMDPDIYARMQRQIVPVAMQVETIDGTWKLNQNKTAAARLGAADGVEAAGIGSETAEMARLMRQVEGE